MEFWADSSDTELSDGVSLVNMGLSHTQTKSFRYCTCI